MTARLQEASNSEAPILLRTSSDTGHGDGGLLMGATMTQHPDAMKVVVSFVDIYDMLRVELSPNGAFNVTEFGTVNDPDQFKALHAYSPYHRVQDATPYPPTLLTPPTFAVSCVTGLVTR